jgi:transglutaminase-like putative cysteine protease
VSETRERRGAEPLDYVLAGVAGALATFSAGMGVSAPNVSMILVSLVVLGTAFSYWASRSSLIPDRIRVGDAFLYAAGLCLANFLSPTLSAFLPEDVFRSREMIAAGALCWMIVAGSFLSWRDGTVLFQAVPCIALFGLVGVWDTYRFATAAFFAFLLCLAALCSRAHVRTMLRRADASGATAIGRSSEEPSRRIELARQGIWKWMAGPEWAIASAAAVVVISLLGAPILQESVQPISGIVQVNVPLPQAQRGAFSSQDGTVQIGRGPLNLSEDPVLRVEMDGRRYLRSRTYTNYSGSGWRTGFGTVNRGLDRASAEAFEEIADPLQIRFKVEVLAPIGGEIPLPGEVVELGARMPLERRSDGTYYTRPDTRSTPPIEGRSIVASDSGSAEFAGRPNPLYHGDLLNLANVRPEVVELAATMAGESGTDYERARRLKEGIETRVRYNLNASAVPQGEDPVAHFLFNSKEGYCDLFASSMVVMARSIGIPARYATGFFPVSGKRDAQGRYLVKGSEGHAWAELYFQGIGWTVFDPTEGAASAVAGARGTAPTPLWRKMLPAAAGGSALILFVAAGGIWLRSRRAVAPTGREALFIQYRRYERALAPLVGRRRMNTETPLEYVQIAISAAGVASGEVEQVGVQLTRALYGPSELPAEEIVALSAEVDAVRRMIGEGRRAAGRSGGVASVRQ